MIETIDLVRTYRKGGREVHALRGVSCRIGRGGVHFIVGTSGSGKSTLLHLLGALDRPSAGRVVFEGSDLEALSDRERTLFRRRKVGFIFQSFNLIPTLAALENVLVPRIPEGIGEAERRRARDLLERVGLGERSDHRPSELSGGESQRVAIARALFNEPPLVLADEPTGELDTETGAEIMGYIRELARERGTTFVIVTHDLEKIRPGEEVLRIRDGRLLEAPAPPSGGGP